MQARHQSRVRQARRLMRKSGADALLVTNFVNVTYLTGFTGDDSYLLLTADDQIVISDSRYTSQLQEESPGFDLEIRTTGMTMPEAVAKVVKKTKSARVAAEAESVTVALWRRLESGLTKSELVTTSGLVEQLRQIKDRHEIGEIRKSVKMAERVFAIIRAAMQGRQTEKEIANHLEYHIRNLGGRGCSFPPIVAVGPRAALPHAVPTDRRIESSDFVLVDWGAQAGLYASDLTRILVTGKISPKLERIYEVVLKAQQRAIKAIRPGARLCDVDAAARDAIATAGYGKRFGHGLGHGIGLEIHEAPRMAVGQQDRLQPGMVVTVEPGIYLPGWGGVRIEDDVLVTRDGHELLSHVPKRLEDCVV